MLGLGLSLPRRRVRLLPRRLWPLEAFLRVLVPEIRPVRHQASNAARPLHDLVVRAAVVARATNTPLAAAAGVRPTRTA
eukprot:14696539-Alexandrium_andersonii.AAC.1